MPILALEASRTGQLAPVPNFATAPSVRDARDAPLLYAVLLLLLLHVPIPPLFLRPRQPFLLALELATAACHGHRDPLGGELPLPVIIFDNQRLESTFLDYLKLMLSSFQRVPRVSALVLESYRRRHAAARRETRARASVPRRRAPTLRPALLNPPMAALSPATHRSAATRCRHRRSWYCSRSWPSSGHPSINRDHPQVALVSLMLLHPSLAAGKPPHRRNRAS